MSTFDFVINVINAFVRINRFGTRPIERPTPVRSLFSLGLYPPVDISSILSSSPAKWYTFQFFAFTYFKMIVPKADIKAIYTYVLTGITSPPPKVHLTFSLEGVMVVKKDFRAPKHDEVAVPNLHVMSVMKSLKSRGFVSEQFSWQYHYYYLTDEGILFLRNYLHMPETVVPATIAKATRGGRQQTRDVREEGRDEYRRGGWRGSKEQTA